MVSHYTENYETGCYGSFYKLANQSHSLSGLDTEPRNTLQYQQILAPAMRLLVIGGEHDSVHLTSMAAHMGWEVIVATVPQDEKEKSNFPGCHKFLSVPPEEFPTEVIDGQTAVVLMTHNYAKDLKYLMGFATIAPLYLGILGPVKRREKLLNELLGQHPEMDFGFFEQLYGPAGLAIAAETPQEIAISILAEILAVSRNGSGESLRNRSKGIHQ